MNSGLILIEQLLQQFLGVSFIFYSSDGYGLVHTAVPYKPPHHCLACVPYCLFGTSHIEQIVPGVLYFVLNDPFDVGYIQVSGQHYVFAS